MSLHLVFSSVADHLKQELNLSSVFVGDPPKNVSTPYLFVWGPLPTVGAAPLALVDERLSVQVVAKAPPECYRLADTVVECLEGFVPDVLGYDCQPLRVVGATTATTGTQVFDPDSNLRPAWLTVTARFRGNRKEV